ncbi:MAG TPA: histidine phosphatase family protein [Planctomycetaceae bacterium]|nr:histidine phosphatase family protein [Planctomycetaceae bacterium]
MKTLLLLRHAKSGWDQPQLADHDRPLTKRGVKAARRMGRLIADDAIALDALLCSMAVRARETWDHVCESMSERGHTPPPASFIADLYHCELEQFAPIIAAAPDTARTLLLIGHNPGLEELLAQLTGEDHHVPTAMLAVLDLDIDAWNEFALNAPATLRHLWRPRELPDAL